MLFGQQRKMDSMVSVLRTSTKKDTAYINTLNELAQELLYYNLDSIAVLANQALELSVEQGYLKGKSEAYLNLGIYHSESDASDKALTYYEQAKKSAAMDKDTIILLETFANMGIEYRYRNQYAAAATTLMEGIEIAKQSKNTLLLELLLGNLAGVYIDQDDYAMAIELDKETLVLVEALNKESFLVNPLYNLAYSHNAIGDYDQATVYIDRLIGVLEQTNKLDSKFKAYITKGKILYNQEKYEEALAWFEKSRELLPHIEDKRVEISLWNNMAMANLKLYTINDARTFAQMAQALTTDKYYYRERSISSDILSQIAEKEGDFKEALAFHKIFKSYEDSLYAELKDKELNILKANREFEKEKEALITANKISLAQQKGINYLFIALFLFAVAIVFIYRKNAQGQKKLNMALELNKNALQINEARLKETNKVKDQLFSIIGHDLRSPVVSLKQLLDICMEEGENGAAVLKKYAPKLQANLSHFQFTLDNLLDWGTSQIKGDAVKPQTIVLRKEIDALCGFYDLLAREKSISLLNMIEPDQTAIADIHHFRVVFRNLLSNAIKFTPEHGNITIAAKSCQGNGICLTVTDTGQGMDVATIQKVLSDEEHYSSQGTNAEKGSGLGLLLAKELIAKNQGVLHIHSTIGEGSRFTVELPVENTKDSWP